MFMIVSLHIMGAGGVLDAVNLLSGKYFLVWSWETAMYCAVNCYAIISGYVCYNKNPKWKNIINLWIQTFFYSAGITALMYVSGLLKNQGMRDIFKSFLPLSSSRYWYFSAYVGLFLFIPLLNKIVEVMDRQTLKKSLAIIVLVLGLPTTVFYGDPFELSYGCSVLWLIIMYLIGAYIKKYDEGKSVDCKKYAIGFLVCVISTSVAKYVIVFAASKIGVSLPGSFLDTNLTPTIVGAAICLVYLFKNLNIKNQKISNAIVYVGSLSYGIFLVHFHPFVVSNFLSGAFSWVAQKPAVLMIPLIILSAGGVYIASAVVEAIRKFLFKVIKIDSLGGFLERKAQYIFDKLSK